MSEASVIVSARSISAVSLTTSALPRAASSAAAVPASVTWASTFCTVTVTMAVTDAPEERLLSYVCAARTSDLFRRYAHTPLPLLSTETG